MRLTDLQKRMLDGELGEPVRQGMEIIVELADFWEAPDLIPIQSVHMPGASAKTARRAGRKYVRWVADSGARFVTTTTLNPGAADLTGFDMGISQETINQQMELTESYKRMGAIECHTCTPYLVGNLPRFGEHVAWGESSAIVFSNSVLGARTNREGGPSALASALTGFTAGYGMHLKKNRIASIHVSVDCPLSDPSEFGAAAYYLAKRYPDALPVFTGLPERCSMIGLRALSAGLATSGSISMFHAVGLTPEAPTLEMATGNRKLETLTIRQKEVEETREYLNRNNLSEVDCVLMGCPHLDFEEVIYIAKLLSGRKVNPKVALWLFAANSIWNNCERSGLAQILRDSGAVLISDTCPTITIFKEVMESKGFGSAATNSAKQAHYLPSSWGMKVHFGSTADCIEAAITGRWKV
ncbi:MAG: aconitase X catalytic domain-containing protein [Thermodesulfobacteriota bacterium]|nr:aconitase X catalytic domain-containing protein [Thermodesulfobacteriota bacterium]